MRTHYLKTDPYMFEAIATGDKKFEVRRDDRGFQRGDVVVLVKMSELSPEYSYNCQRIEMKIGYVLRGNQYGVEDGYVVFGLENNVPDCDNP